MLLPGVSAAGLPTQNDDMWDGLQEGTDAEFDEATNAYVEILNNAQVQTASLHWPHARASMTIRARVYTRTHERTRTRAPHPRPTPALGTCHAQPSPQPSPRGPVRGACLARTHPTLAAHSDHPGSQCDKQYMHTWQKYSTVSLPADWPPLPPSPTPLTPSPEPSFPPR